MSPNPNSPSKTLIIFFFFLLPFTYSTSIHSLLRSHGLPGGLFPRNIKSFDLDTSTGLLEVNLDRPCYAKYDNMAFFDAVVKGNLSYGELRAVEGLSQEELFLWLPVKGISVSEQSKGVILFDIGVARKQMSLSLFEEPRDCRPEGNLLGRPGSNEWIPGRKEKGGSQDQR